MLGVTLPPAGAEKRPTALVGFGRYVVNIQSVEIADVDPYTEASGQRWARVGG